MNIYEPYTYLIGWSKQDKWYYGVRFGKDCHPNELWKTYFTSSKHVKMFVEENGNPDIIEVRKSFDDPKSAQMWENTVLKRLKVTNNNKWLNKTDNMSIDVESSIKGARTPKPEGFGEKIRLANIGKKLSEETRQKISKSRKGQKGFWNGKLLPESAKQKLSEIGKTLTGERNPFYGKHHTEEAKRIMGEKSGKSRLGQKRGKYKPSKN